MGFLIPGWKKKALALQTIVLTSADLAKELAGGRRVYFEAMRAFRRGQIDYEELQRQLEASPPPEDNRWIVHEPMSIYGWDLVAGLYRLDGALWWFVSVDRRSRTFSAKDKSVLVNVVECLGGDLDRDALSLNSLEELVADGTAFILTWKNLAPLLEVQVHSDKKDVRIVPRGSRATDGYVKMPLKDKT